MWATLAIALLIVAVAAGWKSISSRPTPAPQATNALAHVETFPCPERQHVPVGTPIHYPTDPPVCGRHYPTAVKPGFYTSEQAPGSLVHSLEHGEIVIYYDTPGDAALTALKRLARRYTGAWDGVVVVPRKGLGSHLILTAWGKKLELSTFDANAISAFLDAYRGRGPEHPVR